MVYKMNTVYGRRWSSNRYDEKGWQLPFCSIFQNKRIFRLLLAFIPFSGVA
jgi:hypothetical protein